MVGEGYWKALGARGRLGAGSFGNGVHGGIRHRDRVTEKQNESTFGAWKPPSQRDEARLREC